MLLGKQSLHMRDIHVKGRYNLVYNVPNIIDSIGFGIYVNGIYEPAVSELIISHLPQGGVYLDVGANIGSIALPVCKRRPDITAVCIEASPRIFESLKKNFELNRVSNAHLINKAVSDNDEEVLHYMNEADYFGQGHIVSAEGKNTETMVSGRIDTILDGLGINKVDTLKVDIEGYEYFAFKGAEKLLKAADGPTIIFEFEDWSEKRANDSSPGAAQKLLLDYGYTLYKLESNRAPLLINAPVGKGSVMLLAKKSKQ